MQLATPRLPWARGWLSLALYWGQSALFDCIGTGCDARSLTTFGDVGAVRLHGTRARQARGPALATYSGGGVTVCVSTGTLRADQPGDRSYRWSGVGGGGASPFFFVRDSPWVIFHCLHYFVPHMHLAAFCQALKRQQCRPQLVAQHTSEQMTRNNPGGSLCI